MFSLPLIAETQFAALISGQFSGAYEIHNGFSLTPYSLPLVIVMAGKFKECEPFTHVYDGELTVSVLTQIDDVSDPIAAHDNAVSQIYDIMSNPLAVQSGVEAANFHLWQHYSTEYDHGKTEINGHPALSTSLTYKITAQNSGIAS